MIKPEFHFLLIALNLLLLSSTGSFAADLNAGKVAATQCAICHGADGRGNGIPGSSIAGMRAEEFIKHLNDFKNGTRRNVMMERFVNRLSKQDVENLAAYYATQ